jgi:dephospho-CoA kinase
VWPHVKTEIISQIEDIKQRNQCSKQPVTVVLESAVLLDAGWEDLLDGVWAVRAPHKVAVERLVEYRKFTEEEAEKRIQAQKTRRGIGNVEEEVEKGVVTAVIENTGDVEQLKRSLLANLNNDSSWKHR